MSWLDPSEVGEDDEGEEGDGPARMRKRALRWVDPGWSSKVWQ